MMVLEDGLFPPPLKEPFMFMLADCLHAPYHLLIHELDYKLQAFLRNNIFKFSTYSITLLYVISPISKATKDPV